MFWKSKREVLSPMVDLTHTVAALRNAYGE
jgi:hypothetical protein